MGTALLGVPAQALLYDVDPITLSPVEESLEDVLHLGAGVIVVPHFFGRIFPISPIADLAASWGAIVIEDAAQQAGGTHDGTRGGGLADLGVLSFGRGKGLNAGGGGALLIRRGSALPASGFLPEAVSGGRFLHLAKMWAAQCLAHPLLFALPSAIPAFRLGDTVYHDPHPATGMRISSLRVLPWVLQDETRQLRIRRCNEAWYENALLDRPDIRCAPVKAPSESGALRFPVRLPGPRLKASHGGALKGLGVARSYPRTLLAYPAIRAACTNADHAFPGAEELANTLFTLPTHQWITSSDRSKIVHHLLELPAS
jgi:dTDP-4-amino-4,6-dideoxygalactose transaminase